LLETSGKSAAEIERELGIGDGCLRQWKFKLKASGDQAFPGHGNVSADQEELVRLRRELEIVRQERNILKKSSGHLLAPKHMRFQFIDANRNGFAVVLMCKMLAVSPSGYYAWRGRPPSAREMANRELKATIGKVFDDSGQTYGSPRIYQVMRKMGLLSSRNRVARLM